MLLFLQKLFTPKQVKKKYLLIERLHDYIKSDYDLYGEMRNTGMCSYIIDIFDLRDASIIRPILGKHRPEDAYHYSSGLQTGFWYELYDAVPRLEFLKKLMKKYKPFY